MYRQRKIKRTSLPDVSAHLENWLKFPPKEIDQNIAVDNNGFEEELTKIKLLRICVKASTKTKMEIKNMSKDLWLLANRYQNRQRKV